MSEAAAEQEPGSTGEHQDPVVVVQRVDHTLVITFNRPQQRNAVNDAVSAAVAQALDELDGSSDLRVGVIAGNGGVFCAGLDLKAFARGETARVPGRGFAGLVERPPVRPLIAAVEGWALGGGFEIVLACDLVTAGRSARFGLPEVRRGLAARGGGVFRLPQRIPRAIAMEALLTGEPMEAERAAQLGLVNRLVDDGQALDAAMSLAEQIAGNAPRAVRASKRVVMESPDWPSGECFERQKEHLEPVFASADAQEGVAAFRERRAPQWQDS